MMSRGVIERKGPRCSELRKTIYIQVNFKTSYLQNNKLVLVYGLAINSF